MRIPKLLQAALTVVVVYGGARLIFDVVLGQPIPAMLTVYGGCLHLEFLQTERTEA